MAPGPRAAVRRRPAGVRTIGWGRLTACAALVIAIDQAAKALVVSSLQRGESVNVFLGLDLTHTRNSGIAFGLAAGGKALVIAVTALALAVLLAYFAFNSARRGLWAAAGVLLGGALGNLVDRVRLGSVVDFIDPIGWPAFNLADTAIVLGVLGLLYLAEGRGAT